MIAHHFPKETEVITYKTYYQSLPVYLQKRIMIYGWLNELQFGAALEPETSFILPTFTALQKTWQTTKPLCILTRHAHAEDLLTKLDPPPLYQKDFSHSLLVCNSLPND